MEIRPLHIIFGVGSLAVVLLSIWIWRISQDIPDPGDADLLLPRAAELPAEQNAYAGLGAALELAREVGGANRGAPNSEGPSSGDPDWALRWDAQRLVSREAQQVFSMIDEALSRPGMQLPSPGLDDPLIVELPELAQLLDSRALFAAESGDLDLAFRAAHQIVALGERVAIAEGVTLIAAMIGARIQELGFARMRSLLEVPGAHAPRVSTWLDALGDRPIPAAARARVWSGEYEAFKTRFTTGMQKQREELPPFLRGSPSGYFYQPNRTMALIADRFRRYRDSASSCGEELASGEGARDEMEPIDYVRPNAVGEILARVASPNYQRALEQFCALEVRRQGTRGVMALRAYRLDHGGYPETLDALVPGYLARLPADPFNGATLRYSPRKKRLWSVGRDRIDTGGAPPATKDAALDEIAVPLELAVEVAEITE